MKKVITLAVAAILASGAAMAQTATTTTTATVPAPAAVIPSTSVGATTNVAPTTRVEQVDQRLNNQQTRIDNGVEAGQINAKQELRDEKTDAKVSQELSADQAKNSGKITKAEQVHMNKQLNKNSHRIHHQRAKGSEVTPAAAQ